MLKRWFAQSTAASGAGLEKIGTINYRWDQKLLNNSTSIERNKDKKTCPAIETSFAAKDGFNAFFGILQNILWSFYPEDFVGFCTNAIWKFSS